MDEDQVIAELKSQKIDLVSAIPCDKARGLFFRLRKNSGTSASHGKKTAWGSPQGHSSRVPAP